MRALTCPCINEIRFSLLLNLIEFREKISGRHDCDCEVMGMDMFVYVRIYFKTVQV
jgi:hypothetical protein